jgi:RNA polymerase sigma-70 factor (ECF subfamily)
VTADSDRSLAALGDESAFESTVGPLVEPALRLAFAMLGDRNEAEDATQEAITRAWQRRHQLRAVSAVRPWFLAIVANQCRNVRRTRWFGLVRVPAIFARAQPPEDVDEKLDLQPALARLPFKDRLPLFLHFYLDLPVEEVAAALGVSPAAANGRIYRACHRLRPNLEEEEL